MESYTTMQGRNCFTEILDSGHRQEFESGAVRDISEGKGRMDLLPLDVVADLLRYDNRIDPCVKGIDILDCITLYMRGPHDPSDEKLIFHALFTFGRENGWELPTMILHVSKHFEAGCNKYGERNWEKGIPAHCYIDSALRHYFKWMRGDIDEPHDRAFVWNLLCLLWTMRHRPECNDLWSAADGDGG